MRRGAPFAGHRPKQPEDTVLYEVVSEHLESLKALAAAMGSLPTFVERELEAFLKCGHLQHGFARCVCELKHLCAVQLQEAEVLPIVSRSADERYLDSSHRARPAARSDPSLVPGIDHGPGNSLSLGITECSEARPVLGAQPRVGGPWHRELQRSVARALSGSARWSWWPPAAKARTPGASSATERLRRSSAGRRPKPIATCPGGPSRRARLSLPPAPIPVSPCALATRHPRRRCRPVWIVNTCR